MIAQDERERKIIQLARKFLSRTVDQIEPSHPLIYAYDLNEADIDAGFIYRFDPVLNEQLDQARAMMRALVGKDGCEPLSGHDAVRWLIHLEDNPGVRLSITLGGSNGTGYAFATDKGAYRCLDQELEVAYGRTIGDPSEAERVLKLIFLEANQTNKVQEKIARMGLACGMLPHESGERFYSPHDLEQRKQHLIEWVIRGEIVPSFLDEVMDIRDQKVGKGIVRTIRPQRWPHGQWQVASNYDRTWHYERGDSKKTLREVRVRTWAIYYLARRGGGRLTELDAIKRWYEPTGIAEDEMIKLTVYQQQRDNLLAGGSSKTHKI